MIEDSLPGANEGPSQLADTVGETPTLDDDQAIVLPNPSPRKGVRGSFLNRMQSPLKPVPVATPEKSPAAKSLDDVLARSRAKQSAQGVSTGDSPGRGGKKSPAPGKGGRKSPAISVRRKLTLDQEEVCLFVCLSVS